MEIFKQIAAKVLIGSLGLALFASIDQVGISKELYGLAKQFVNQNSAPSEMEVLTLMALRKSLEVFMKTRKKRTQTPKQPLNLNELPAVPPSTAGESVQAYFSKI